MKKKYITETSNDYALLDKHTGEILDFKQTRKVDIDTYIMVFFSSIPEVMKLPGLHLKVLMCCWKKSTYNNTEPEGNLICNNTIFKDYVRSVGLDLSDVAIDVIMSKLSKSELLIRKCRGYYMLNPEYFFKGTLSNRSKLIFNLVVEPKINEELNI